MTGINDAFDDDLTVGYTRQRLADFTVEQIALGFINAMKGQALENAGDILSHFYFTDTEYADDPVRIRMDPTGYATRRQRTRAHLMYALKLLPIQLMNDNYLTGVDFYEQYRGQPLFDGILDNKNDPRTLQQERGQIANASTVSTLEKGDHLSTRQSTLNSTILRVPGHTNNAYDIRISLVGREIAKKHLFSTLLEFIFTLGLGNAAAEISFAHSTNENVPAWAFAIENPESSISFQVFQLLGVLEAIARYCVLQDTYRELVFGFFADGMYVAGGCVTKADRTRMWCNGLRREEQQSTSSNLTAISSL